MSVKHAALNVVNSALRPLDLRIARSSQLDRLCGRQTTAPSFNESLLPEGAPEYLRPDNPRLVELQRRYKALGHPAAASSQWSDAFVSTDIDLRYFRGDNAYVYQFRGSNTELHFILTAYYTKTIDALGLLDRLSEDDLFGVYLFDFNNGRKASRDLLDSVNEIYFLERALGISRRPGLSLLDIGAGYGRLAHRATRALPELGRVFCADAVAASTFVSEYYLRFRGADDRAEVVPLDELEGRLAGQRVDLAVNIHSFSEIPRSAIEWWINFIRRLEVRHFMVVPNPYEHGGSRLESLEADGSRTDYLPVLAAAGYRRVTAEPKYLDREVQKYGVSPTTYHLFELTGRA
ncbi:MAG: putative sugar O-methyltransferase [Acidobacteriota bacterium]|nr:putative sugar O-methyltransferase [Acidobacteriota bacterium]